MVLFTKEKYYKCSKREQDLQSITKGVESCEDFDSRNIENRASLIWWTFGNTNGI